MTAREYLQRAWQIDGRIGRRLEERARLRTMLNAETSASDEGPREAESALIAMDEAIGIVVVANQAKSLTQLVGRLQPTQEELIIEFVLVEREDSHSDGAYLVLA